MAKFIFSLGDANYQMLKSEAKARDITIQELLRAVIIPDWMKTSMEARTLGNQAASSLVPSSTGILNRSSFAQPTSIGRLNLKP